MNRMIISLALATNLAVGVISPVSAQNTRTSTSPVVPGQEQATTASNSEEQNARDWGLRLEGGHVTGR